MLTCDEGENKIDPPQYILSLNFFLKTTWNTLYFYICCNMCAYAAIPSYTYSHSQPLKLARATYIQEVRILRKI